MSRGYGHVQRQLLILLDPNNRRYWPTAALAAAVYRKPRWWLTPAQLNSVRNALRSLERDKRVKRYRDPREDERFFWGRISPKAD